MNRQLNHFEAEAHDRQYKKKDISDHGQLGDYTPEEEAGVALVVIFGTLIAAIGVVVFLLALIFTN